MRKAFRASGVLALAAMLGSVASPAIAGRGWYGGGHGGWSGHHHPRHHHRHRGHDDGFGAFLGAAAIIGAVAVLASSANRNAKAERAYPPEAMPSDEDAVAASEGAAVDACAAAAEDEAAQGGIDAEVRDITGTQPVEGGWIVDGSISHQAAGPRDEGVTRQFTCTWRNGRVADIILDRDDSAG